MSTPESEIFAAVVKSHNAQLDYIRKLEAVVEAGKRLRGTITIDDEGWELDEHELIDECENFDKAIASLES